MPRTVKGLTEEQFEAQASKKLQSKIDSSSHQMEFVHLRKDKTQIYLKKSYASPDHAKSSGSDRSTYVSNLLTYIAPMISSHSIEDPLEMNKQMEFSGQLESFYSAIYRILLCDRAAETYAIFNDEGNCVGTASKFVDSFISARKKKIIIQDHIADLAKMFVASYLLEEDDLHRGNFGIAMLNGKLRIFRLDFDMSGWSRTYKLKGKRGVSYGSVLMSSPQNRFELDEGDVRNLPVLSKAKPFYWATNLFYFFDDAQDYANLKDDLAFNRTKYLSMLQFCLIPDSIFRTIGALYIEDKYEIDRSKHVEALIERKEELLKILIKLPAFYCVLNNEGDFYKKGFSAWREVEKSFQEYNEFARKTHAFQSKELISLDIVRQNFEHVCKAVKEYEPKEHEKRFKHKSFEPFEIPKNELNRYRIRKENVRKLLASRLSDLISDNDDSSKAMKILYGSYAKAQSTYDKYVRKKNVKKIKIAWLREVLENSKDESKVIMEWFQTKDTPFYPVIQTGYTGDLIDQIKKSESEYAYNLMLSRKKRAASKSSSRSQVTFESESIEIQDAFERYHAKRGSEKEMLAYFDKLKYFLEKKVRAYVKDYAHSSYSSYFDRIKGEGQRRAHKHKYWARVQKDLAKADNFQNLFDIFVFKFQEKIYQDDILAGDNTARFIALINIMKKTLPEIPTERNHAICWVSMLLSKSSLTTYSSKLSFFTGSSETPCPNYALRETLKNLRDQEESSSSIQDCFAPFKSLLLETYYPDIADLLSLFNSDAVRYHAVKSTGDEEYAFAFK